MRCAMLYGTGGVQPENEGSKSGLQVIRDGGQTLKECLLVSFGDSCISLVLIYRETNARGAN